MTATSSTCYIHAIAFFFLASLNYFFSSFHLPLPILLYHRYLIKYSYYNGSHQNISPQSPTTTNITITANETTREIEVQKLEPFYSAVTANCTTALYPGTVLYFRHFPQCFLLSCHHSVVHSNRTTLQLKPFICLSFLLYPCSIRHNVLPFWRFKLGSNWYEKLDFVRL
jgi:hypothetical protein